MSRRGHTTWARRRGRRGLGFVVPFFAGFGIFTVVPLLYALYTSFYSTKLIGGTVFSGLDNYRETLGSGLFWDGVIRVVIFGAVQITVMLIIAFFFASIFDLGIVRFGAVFRTIFFMPFAVPIVVAALMWGFLLEPQYGPITRLASGIGLGDVNFFSPSLMLPSIIVIVIWEFTGYNMVILYTALRSVPRDVVEAAILDGATLRTIIVAIKLPMVRPAVIMLIFLNVIGASQLFVEPLILNNYQGGVITSSYTPTLYIYNTAIHGAQYNLAAAMAVTLGLVVVALSAAALIFRSRRGELT